jgi:hypothetical protein
MTIADHIYLLFRKPQTTEPTMVMPAITLPVLLLKLLVFKGCDEVRIAVKLDVWKVDEIV